MNGDHALPIVKVSQDLEPQLVRDLAQKSSLTPAKLHLDADPGQLGAPVPFLPRQLDAQRPERQEQEGQVPKAPWS